MAKTLEDLLPLLQQMAERRQSPRSLSEWAQEAHASPTHFQRTFARLVGESPKKYGDRLRLEAAAMLLLCSEASVLDIALDVGFGSHEVFTRAFRQHFEMSPRAFRQANACLSPAAADRHAQVVRHVGPCIGLYRMSTHDPKEST